MMGPKADFFNISLRERLTRFVYGIFFFSAGVWGWAFLTINGFHTVFKACLFVLFYMGFLGVCQALLSFCVQRYSGYERRAKGFFARRTARKHRKTALAIHLASVIGAALSTVYFVFLQV